MKPQVDLDILGHHLLVVSEEGEAHIREVARLVSERMAQLDASQPAASTLQIALLAALNIASDYWKLRKDGRELEEAIERLSLRMLERLERLS